MVKGILKTVDNINRTEGKVEIWECILGGSIGGGICAIIGIILMFTVDPWWLGLIFTVAGLIGIGSAVLCYKFRNKKWVQRVAGVEMDLDIVRALRRP